MSNAITPSSGQLTLGILPEGGGSITRFDWSDGGRTIALMRHSDQSTIDHALSGDPPATSSFRLILFRGRIANARYSFDGRDIGRRKIPFRNRTPFTATAGRLHGGLSLQAQTL